MWLVYQWIDLRCNAQKIYLPLLWNPTLAGGSPAYFQPVMDWGMWKEVKLWAVRETSKAVMLMLIPPPLEAGTVPTRPTANCTGAQALLDTHSALQMQKLPANISRHFTMYFSLFYCSVNWQQCGIIVPLGLIQCAFGYQCHSFFFSFFFSQNNSSPFHLLWKNSWWFSCTCLSIAQRYFPNLVKWDLGTSGHTVEAVHAVQTLHLFSTTIWEEK